MNLTFAHHILKAQTAHNEIRQQRDMLLEACDLMLAAYRPPLNAAAEQLAWAAGYRAVALVRKAQEQKS